MQTISTTSTAAALKAQRYIAAIDTQFVPKFTAAEKRAAQDLRAFRKYHSKTLTYLDRLNDNEGVAIKATQPNHTDLVRFVVELKSVRRTRAKHMSIAKRCYVRGYTHTGVKVYESLVGLVDERRNKTPDSNYHKTLRAARALIDDLLQMQLWMLEPQDVAGWADYDPSNVQPDPWQELIDAEKAKGVEQPAMETADGRKPYRLAGGYVIWK